MRAAHGSRSGISANAMTSRPLQAVERQEVVARYGARHVQGVGEAECARVGGVMGECQRRGGRGGRCEAGMWLPWGAGRMIGG